MANHDPREHEKDLHAADRTSLQYDGSESGQQSARAPTAVQTRAESDAGEAVMDVSSTDATPAAESAPGMPPELPSRKQEERVEDGGQVERSEPVLWPWLYNLFYQMPSWLASTVFHMALLIFLAWFTLPPAAADKMVNDLLVSSTDQKADDLEQLEDRPLDEVDLDTAPDDLLAIEEVVGSRKSDLPPIEAIAPAAAPAADLREFGFKTAPRDDPMAAIGGLGGGALSGRGDQLRKAMVAKYGGTRQSEKAVELALEWLAEHQFPDGGWSFAHSLAPKCHGQCDQPCSGHLASARNAATGMALLPFLGAGQTHKKGKYRKVVQAGLYFLTSHQDPATGSLWDPAGRMYSHGIASIALCEAYAMTQDPGLLEPAQKAIDFICYAQDQVGGGWRYDPHQRGDTSVLGWQIMALKSAHLAYLRVPAETVKKASKFLDSVQSSSGANYGYLTPGEGPSAEATTAIGVLCRMYLGSKKTEPDLERGVQWLSRRGPNRNLYYDYYATQVLHHWEGKPWKKWNAVMRDDLVSTQTRSGHETGSWFIPRDKHNQLAGRLYCTAMATMILEVYYRQMPIYAKQSTEEEFPLE